MLLEKLEKKVEIGETVTKKEKGCFKQVNQGETEQDLTEAGINAFDVGAIPHAPKKWHPPKPCLNIKSYETKF